MKKVIAVFVLLSAGFANSVSANGFSPWSENASQSTAQSILNEQQKVINIRSFYRANTNAIDEVGGEPQANIQIRPWYAADKV